MYKDSGFFWVCWTTLRQDLTYHFQALWFWISCLYPIKGHYVSWVAIVIGSFNVLVVICLSVFGVNVIDCHLDALRS